MARFPISLQEALKRLSDKLNIECLLQQETRTQVFKMDRTHVVALLEREATKIEESGYFGQRMNMGIHLPVNHRELGEGWLFIETRPEAKVDDEVIRAREKEKAKELGLTANESTSKRRF
jgi:hypothetical protein